eukprot:2213835-Prymnesium_polylepis.1
MGAHLRCVRSDFTFAPRPPRPEGIVMHWWNYELHNERNTHSDGGGGIMKLILIVPPVSDPPQHHAAPTDEQTNG